MNKKFDVIPFKIGKNTSPYSWHQSYEILTYCEHYPHAKVGGDKYCGKCEHFVGYIDNGNDDMSVKCSHNYTRAYRFKMWFKKLKNIK